MGHLKTVDGKALPDRPMRGHSGTQRLRRQGTTPFSTEIRIKLIVHFNTMLRASFERNVHIDGHPNLMSQNATSRDLVGQQLPLMHVVRTCTTSAVTR